MDQVMDDTDPPVYEIKANMEHWRTWKTFIESVQKMQSSIVIK